MKKFTTILLSLLCVFTFFGCSKNNKTEIAGTVTRDNKYNSAIVSFSPDQFTQAGFNFGDSCNVVFGNGYKIDDVPFYNGYYVKNNEPVIVLYPGYSYISITYNNNGIWDIADLNEGDKITITLKEAGKYSSIQETLGQEYSFDYQKYKNSEEFCNFRELSGGNLKEKLLYRGASPVDNSRNRASYTDKLLENSGISYIVDLADSIEDMEGYLEDDSFNSPYAANLYENDCVVLLDMSSSYQAEAYQKKVAEGLTAMLEASGPIYIHCMEGKDRTGFVCMLIEALAGASYDEMSVDYMKTYENYYGVSLKDTPEKYQAIEELYFVPFVSYLHKTDNIDELKKADYVSDAKEYLLAGGMRENDIEQLIELISE